MNHGVGRSLYDHLMIMVTMVTMMPILPTVILHRMGRVVRSFTLMSIAHEIESACSLFLSWAELVRMDFPELVCQIFMSLSPRSLFWAGTKLVALVWLFSAVCFQIQCPQIAVRFTFPELAPNRKFKFNSEHQICLHCTWDWVRLSVRFSWAVGFTFPELLCVRFSSWAPNMCLHCTWDVACQPVLRISTRRTLAIAQQGEMDKEPVFRFDFAETLFSLCNL